MNVSLTPKLEKLVQKKVASGRYTSASEVVREALRLLEEKDRDRAAALEDLRAKIKAGLDELDRGEGIRVKREDLKGFMEGIMVRGEERVIKERSSRG